VPVPVNTLLTEDEYHFMLEDSRARLRIVSEELYPKFAKLIAGQNELTHVVVSNEKTQGHAQFEALLAGAPRDPVTAPTARDEIRFWLYTSGSTGKPKAAVHTHADLKFTDDLYGKPFLGITENDVCYSVAKLFFAYGLGNALTFPMSAGATNGAARAAADAGTGGERSDEARGHSVLRGADFLRRISRRPGCAAARRCSDSPLRFGR
jgi:acyl-coenzyme A synthetase/AMP-(fatty) acid ligase